MRKLACMLAALAAAAALSGCTADQCDPSTDTGFFSKIGCAAGGGYAKRVEAKKQDIAALREEQAALTNEVIELNDEDLAVKESRAKMQSRLDRIDEQLDALEAKVASAGAQDAKLRKQIEAAKAQVAQVRKVPEDATVLQKRAEYEELQSSLNAISNAIAAPGVSDAY
ncbi:MAG: hypothetical protein ACI4NA_09125 [Succinivibrio sp.]